MKTIKEYGLCQRVMNQAALYSEKRVARIIAQHKGLYQVATETGEGLAQVSGRLRFDTLEASCYPAVGDFVMLSLSEETQGTERIVRVLERKSVFLRKAAGQGSQAQVVAANIDVLFLCMSLNHNFNLNRMERYLAIGWDSGAKPVVLLTKADLCDDLSEKLEQVRCLSPYTEIVTTSAWDEQACQRAARLIPAGQTASFIGSSGVGKSTLINRLMGRQVQATADIGYEDRGRHTTTSREMLVLPNGGIVIDTPGMREMGLDSVDLSKSFEDIEELAGECRFSDCTHHNERGCAVHAALAEGRLDQRRWQNYLKLQRETAYSGLSARQLETAKGNEMFKEVGGVKNIRRYNRENDKRRR